MSTVPDEPNPKNTEAAMQPKRRWRRRAFFAFLLLAALLPGYGVYLEIKCRMPGVTMYNFRRIKVGMSEKEIESYLGPKWAEMKNDGWEGDNPFPKTCSWHGAEHWVHVDFDAQGRAGDLQLIPLRDEEPKESALDKLRRWIGLK